MIRIENVEQGKYYKSLITDEFVRVDSFNSPDDPIGVHFHHFENYVFISSEIPLHMFFEMEAFKEITEKEFYTALDLAREQFMKDFKAIRGGVL
ncbi:hypothetical protein AB4865_07780 [Capnocytophaga sp. ARDL2]|uniref:hypothetical protein n=1 Tax=Capnocytophaga sp. ARDL2 TaxID=3238809 RepID=UPI003556CD8B